MSQVVVSPGVTEKGAVRIPLSSPVLPFVSATCKTPGALRGQLRCVENQPHYFALGSPLVFTHGLRVGVHRGADVGMAQQLLLYLDIRPICSQRPGQSVPEADTWREQVLRTPAEE